MFHTLAAWHSGELCLRDPSAGLALLAYLGDREGTFRCLEECIDTGKLHYFVKVDPDFDPYRDDPRFQALLARVGLDD